MPPPYEIPFVSFVLFVVKKQNRVMPLANHGKEPRGVLR
jgi:hypothetical protein